MRKKEEGRGLSCASGSMELLSTKTWKVLGKEDAGEGRSRVWLGCVESLKCVFGDLDGNVTEEADRQVWSYLEMSKLVMVAYRWGPSLFCYYN
jgi:hypothetical protein